MLAIERSSKIARKMLIFAIVLALFAAGYSYISKRLAAERLYKEAIVAQEEGDLEQARAKLGDVIQINPNYKDSKDKLAEVKKQIAIRNDPKLAAVYAEDERNKAPSGKRMARPKKTNPKKNEPGIGEGSHKLSFSSGVKTVFNSNELPGYKLTSSRASKVATLRVYEALKPDEQLRKLIVKTAEYNDQGKLSNAVYSFRFEYPRNPQNIWVRGTMAYYGNNGKNQSVLAWDQGNELYAIEAVQTTSTPPGASLQPLMNLLP